MEYKKMHSCSNDCILYRNEYKDLRRCPRCGLSRYKVKVGQNDEIDELTKEGDAKNLRRHAENRKCDGLLRHPADSLQWKNIDKEFPKFGKESRKLRFGLVTDGMNPFGNLCSNHSSWPVLLVIYNLPPALCMKCKYMMLSMMFFGPKQLGNDINVYLNPLIEDLKLLWNEGVDVFDAFKNEPRHLVKPIDSTVYLCTNTNRIIYKLYYILTNLSICLIVDE